MAGPPPYPDTADDTGVGPGRGSPPRMPRWVKVSGIILIVLVLLVIGLMFVTGLEGGPGPGQHGPGGESAGQIEQDVRGDRAPGNEAPGGDAPPEGGH